MIGSHPLEELRLEFGRPTQPGALRTDGELGAEVVDCVHHHAVGDPAQQVAGDVPEDRPEWGQRLWFEVPVQGFAGCAMLGTIQTVRHLQVGGDRAGEGVRVHGGRDHIRMSQQDVLALRVADDRVRRTQFIGVFTQVAAGGIEIIWGVLGHLALLRWRFLLPNRSK